MKKLLFSLIVLGSLHTMSFVGMHAMDSKESREEDVVDGIDINEPNLNVLLDKAAHHLDIGTCRDVLGRGRNNPHFNIKINRFTHRPSGDTTLVSMLRMYVMYLNQDRRRRNPALENKLVEICTLLIRAGGTITVDDNGDGGASPLHLACEAQSYQLITMLLELDANINARTVEGYTPLHYLRKSLSPSDELDALLLSYGAECCTDLCLTCERSADERASLHKRGHKIRDHARRPAQTLKPRSYVPLVLVTCCAFLLAHQLLMRWQAYLDNSSWFSRLL